MKWRMGLSCLTVGILWLGSAIPQSAAGWSASLVVTRAFTEDTDEIILYTTGGSQYVPGCVIDSWTLPMGTEARRARTVTARPNGFR